MKIIAYNYNCLVYKKCFNIFPVGIVGRQQQRHPNTGQCSRQRRVQGGGGCS